MPGRGKCARIQQTAHDGRTTRTSLPKIPQHHLANCLYAIVYTLYADFACVLGLRMLRGTAVYTGTTLFEEPSDSSTQRGNQGVV